MAPGQCLAQCAVARQAGARAAREQAQPFAQALAHTGQAEQRHTAGGQLDRQWQAVELAADLNHVCGIAFVQHEARQPSRYALHQ